MIADSRAPVRPWRDEISRQHGYCGQWSDRQGGREERGPQVDERGHQPVGNIARTRLVVIMGLGKDTAERGDAASQDIHRMRGGGQQFQRLQHR
jgi:hypothetical protein